MDLVSTTALGAGHDAAPDAARSFADARRHAIYQIAHTAVRAYPFPHVFVEDVFPHDFYARLQALLPPDDAYAVASLDANRNPGQLALSARRARTERLDPERRAFWSATLAALDHADTGAWMIAKFYEALSERLGLADAETGPGRDLRGSVTLLRDRRTGGEGPGTGETGTVVTAIFQLARNANRRELGPTLYMPKDPGLRCAGGRCHDRDAFERITTLPYRPNTLLAFPKTDASFVGFEGTDDAEACRDILRFDLALPARLMH
jgi:hypothetical protein